MLGMVLIPMWLQPAGEAVKAQIGPVFDTGTVEVSVYPYGPGFIDISNDEGLLYSNKNGGLVIFHFSMVLYYGRAHIYV